MPKQPPEKENLTGSFLLSLSKLAHALEKDEDFQKFKKELDEKNDTKDKIDPHRIQDIADLRVAESD